MSESTIDNLATNGLDRRRFLRNAGIAGSAAWVIPSVVTKSPVFAQATSGSEPPCAIEVDSFGGAGYRIDTGENLVPVYDSRFTTAAIGDYRDIVLQQTTTSPFSKASIIINDGVLTINNDNNIASIASIRADGPSDAATDSFTALDVDVTINTDPAFLLRVLSNDNGGSARLELTDTSGNLAFVVMAIPAGVTGDFYFNNADFETNNPAIDLEHVGAIELIITSNQSTDLSLEFFGAGCPNPVTI